MFRAYLALPLVLCLLTGPAVAQTKHKKPSPKPAVLSAEELKEQVYEAVADGDLATVKALVTKGAKISGYRGLLCDVGGTPAQALEMAKYLVLKGVDVNTADDMSGQPPVTAMISEGDDYAEVVRFLITKGARTNMRTKNGSTLLHFAVSLGQPKIVKILIANHLNVNDRSVYVDPFAVQRGMPPALLADFEHEVNEMVGHMMEPGYRYEGVTPLFELRNSWNAEVAKALLDAGADIKAVDDNGWGVLHYAAVSRSADMARFFLEKGCDINSATKIGNRPLHLAVGVANGMASEEVVRVFVNRGADRNAVNKDGQTAFARLREMSDWMLTKQLGSTEPYSDKLVADLLASFNKAAKAIDPNGQPLTLPKLPSNENGVRYEPVMFTALRAERWVRADKDRVTLTLKFSPMGQEGLTISFDDAELEGYETISKLPRIVDLDAEQPTYIQLQFPAEANTGAHLSTKFRLIAGGMDDVSSEYDDQFVEAPFLSATVTKKSGFVSVTGALDKRTAVIRLDEVSIDGKVVPNAKGKEYTVAPGKSVVIKEAKTRTGHPCKVKFSYRYLPNKHWRTSFQVF